MTITRCECGAGFAQPDTDQYGRDRTGRPVLLAGAARLSAYRAAVERYYADCAQHDCHKEQS